MQKVSRMVTATILSMSLLTVMAGAAIAPALGIIKAHFGNVPSLLVQLIVSMPALLVIATNTLFPLISRRWRTRTIALAGLLLYVVSGAGCYFVDNIYGLLLMRAVLGVSVGLIMPLSTGLLAFYFPPEEQARLMGLSAFMNQMGGVVATLLAGLLATVEWNYTFLVYLLGLIAVALVVRFLPSEQLGEREQDSAGMWQRVRQFHPMVLGMLLLMMIFFVFPTHFAITAREEGLSVTTVTMMMVGLDFVASLVGLGFGRLMRWWGSKVKFFAPLLFALGFGCYCLGGMVWLVLGCALIGFANGVGVPYLNTAGSMMAGKNAATTVMPLLSAALYLGQFVSPLVVNPLADSIFGAADTTGAYKVAMVLSGVFLLQQVGTLVLKRMYRRGNASAAVHKTAA